MIRQKAVSLADQVFEHLENDILTGILEPGQIVTEARLAEELGVSRTPVREALKCLEQEHMIEDTGKGLLIIGITDTAARHIYAIRKKIEGMVAAEAAVNITDEQLAELRNIMEFQEFYLARGNSEGVRQMDSSFHDLMYKASGSTIYYDTLIDLHRKIQKYRTISVSSPGRAMKSVHEHRAIFNALAAHDPAAAGEAADIHVRNAEQSILGKTGQETPENEKN